MYKIGQSGSVCNIKITYFNRNRLDFFLSFSGTLLTADEWHRWGRERRSYVVSQNLGICMCKRNMPKTAGWIADAGSVTISFVTGLYVPIGYSRTFRHVLVFLTFHSHGLLLAAVCSAESASVKTYNYK